VSQELDDRLRVAISLRDRLSAEAQRISGKKEAAEQALAKVREEIKAKKIDPDNLDETITKLEGAYTQAVGAFEAEVSSAKEALKPYMENDA